MEKIQEFSSFNDIEKRTPILDQESAKQFDTEKIDQQWMFITEAIRQDVLTDPEVRKKVASYVNFSLSESLPHEFLSDLSLDERVLKLKNRYEQMIGNFLELESVPDDQIQPNIRRAKLLDSPENVIETLSNIYGLDSSGFRTRLDEYISSGTFLKGITTQEKLMIAQRYRFARDIKLLALGAEILEQYEDVIDNNSQEIKLQSGVVINIDVEDETKRQELLNVQSWEKRRQLKDRVYVIDVGGSKYILKEKKTERHTDTINVQYAKGLTSLEEFQAAKDLQANGVIEKNNIKISWEKPVATVIFPDGFQFTVFEYTDELIEDSNITLRLANEIQNNREQFEKEFEIIKEMANKFKDSPKIIKFEKAETESGLKKILKWMGLKKDVISELSFEDFSMIKSLRMQSQAKQMQQESVIRSGYFDRDSDSVFKINLQNKILQLELFGFDLEYFSKIDKNMIDDELKKYKDYKEQNEENIGFATWSNNSSVTRIQEAGYLAMLELEKLLEDKK